MFHRSQRLREPGYNDSSADLRELDNKRIQDSDFSGFNGLMNRPYCGLVQELVGAGDERLRRSDWRAPPYPDALVSQL
ncbi:hypothetical protein GLA29479_4377 [Lysobacter antibioticus]|uniref:hypothetical protein n=1 Tax=Lysobacter antibioticus TaxID=84531 RepID=UPI0007216C18|nr:hypothetical protein [Lysobacter antibioticus]ALN65214.1 hypothetical protein GLA29479_4377 [Lysobacter antibioticus]